MGVCVCARVCVCVCVCVCVSHGDFNVEILTEMKLLLCLDLAHHHVVNQS